MTHDNDNRPGSRAPIVGGVLAFLALGAAALTFLAGSMMGQYGSGGWFRGLALESLLLMVWMAWSGSLLIRRSVWHTFRLPGAFAVAGGVVGIVTNLPYSFTYSPNAESVAQARGFCIIGVIALVAGVGHLYAAKNVRTRRTLHRIALGGPIVLLGSIVYSYLTRGY